MYDISRLLLMRATSSLHPGAGDGIGFIDKPIQRQADNNYPKMEGSGIKGVIREYFTPKKPNEESERTAEYNKKITEINAAFGPEGNDDSQKSALNFQDARILLFPVPTPIGNTLYITCRAVLERFKREINHLKPNTIGLGSLSELSIDKCYAFVDNTDAEVCVNGKMMLDNYVLTPVKLNDNLSTWIANALFDTNPDDYFHEFYKKRIVIVHNELFTFFVKHRTEVITGNRIDSETGVVKDGALFTYEYLPEGTVFYTFVEAGPERKEKATRESKDIMKIFTDGLAQPTYLKMGGRTSVGKGEVAIKLLTLNQ